MPAKPEPPDNRRQFSLVTRWAGYLACVAAGGKLLLSALARVSIIYPTRPGPGDGETLSAKTSPGPTNSLVVNPGMVALEKPAGRANLRELLRAHPVNED
jgi:hypothetical protein